MSALFAKLNLKDQKSIVVLDAPGSFEPVLAELTGVTVARQVKKGVAVHFAIAFATTQKALDASSKALTAAAEGDAILWIAYPKGTSKRYTCEFNRDSGWTVLGAAGFDTVRMVAIDEDWSALRFRRSIYMKSVTRDPARALTSDAKARTTAVTQRASAKGAAQKTTKPATKTTSRSQLSAKTAKPPRRKST